MCGTEIVAQRKESNKIQSRFGQGVLALDSCLCFKGTSIDRISQKHLVTHSQKGVPKAVKDDALEYPGFRYL